MIDRARAKSLRLRPPVAGRLRSSAGSDIRHFQSQLQISLPQDYRDFLEAYAGSSIDAEFDVGGRCPSGSMQAVEHFYGFQRTRAGQSELLEAYELYSDRLPRGVIPIGHDGIGNEIVISTRAQDHGSVSFYDRSDEQSSGTKNAVTRLYLCAESFSAFLERLRPASDEQELSTGDPKDENTESSKIWARLMSGKVPAAERKKLIAQMQILARKQSK